MNLREQLRQQATSVRQQKAAENSRELKDQAFYREAILPALRAAADYFRAVVGDLEVVQPNIRFALPLGPRTEPEVHFRQSNYRFSMDQEEQIGELFVTARCEMNAVLSRHIDDVREADAYEAMLRERGLPYFRRRSEDLRKGRTENSHFTVEGGMPCGFKLLADIPGQRINVQTHNLEDLPLRTHLLQPQRFDEAFFESLARLLLREQSQLVSTEVSEEVRQRLQQQIAAGEQASLQHQAAEAARQAALQNRGGLAGLKASIDGARSTFSDRVGSLLSRDKDS